MSASAFDAEHCDNACDRAGEPKQDVKADNRLKEGRRGRDGNASNDRHAISHPFSFN
jgi:hypothetical protein